MAVTQHLGWSHGNLKWFRNNCKYMAPMLANKAPKVFPKIFIVTVDISPLYPSIHNGLIDIDNIIM